MIQVAEGRAVASFTRDKPKLRQPTINSIRLPRPELGYCAVSVKVTVFVPVTVAAIFTVFAVLGSVYTVLACPVLSLIPVRFEKLPPAPPSLKVTVAPATFSPEASWTRTISGAGRTVETGPVCLLPETIVSLTGGPVVDVSVKTAGERAVLVQVIVMVASFFGKV